MTYLMRALTKDDEPIVWEMLMYAAHEPSLDAVKAQPCLTPYAQDWGRPGDMGFVAFIDAAPNAMSIGAAWLRLWSGENRGFVYLDAAIPELAMAVLPDYRGQGVGTQLLSQVLETAQASFSAVCLSVRAENPVVRLYQRAGFVKIEGSAIANRTGGISFNMVKQFSH